MKRLVGLPLSISVLKIYDPRLSVTQLPLRIAVTDRHSVADEGVELLIC